MDTLLRDESDPGRLRLSGELSIFEAASLRDALLPALEAVPELSIDLSGVTGLDSSGVQLMLVLRREAARTGKTLTWTGHSQSVVRVLELLNLGAAFAAPAQSGN
jgi:anti-anti-sigma factor